MSEALIALGSNLGDRLSHLQEALELLHADVRVLGVSRVYETEPMYVADQPVFYNAAVLIETDMGPTPLLQLLKRTEKEVGRISGEPNGPREVDLDLITYGSLAYRYRQGARTILTVPHSRTAERRFVLAPLNDLGAHRVLVGMGTVGMLLAQTESQRESVKPSEDAVLSIPGGR